MNHPQTSNFITTLPYGNDQGSLVTFLGEGGIDDVGVVAVPFRRI